MALLTLCPYNYPTIVTIPPLRYFVPCCPNNFSYNSYFTPHTHTHTSFTAQKIFTPHTNHTTNISLQKMLSRQHFALLTFHITNICHEELFLIFVSNKHFVHFSIHLTKHNLYPVTAIEQMQPFFVWLLVH